MRKRAGMEPILCAVMLFLATGIAGIIAYQTDASSVQNDMVPGWNESEITEEFPEPDPVIPDQTNVAAKKVAVTNTAGVPCYVRVYLAAENSDIPLAFLYEGETGYHTEDWVLEEDGYYYYKHVLEEGEDTSYLIDSVRIGGSTEKEEYWDVISDIRILVYAETVQAKNADTGEAWKSYQEAWDHYLSVPS